jgi:hypothetical protein
MKKNKKRVTDVFFAKPPQIGPSYNKKKPHRLVNEVEVYVLFYTPAGMEYISFKIPEGYLFNGANVIHKDRLLYAALVHDWLCEHHYDCDNDRYISTLIFVKLAEKAACNDISCWILKHSVDNFQKIAGHWK